MLFNEKQIFPAWPPGIRRILNLCEDQSPAHITRSFIFQATPTVHTNPSRRRSFSKTLIKPVESENVSFAFECGQKTLWKRSIFANDDVMMIYARDISLHEFYFKKRIWQVIVAFPNSSVEICTKDIWCVLTMRSPFSNSSRALVSEGPKSLTNGKVRFYFC